MSDYTITTDFSPKDALPTSDPEKLILGADLDVEFDAIQVAIATKYDSSDIATQAQAEAGVSNEVLITPLRLAQHLADAGGGGAGVVTDLIALTDPGADRLLFWDESANNTTWLTVGAGLTITDTTITADAAGISHDSLSGFVANEHIDHTSVTITAGAGLSYSVGGTDISASATIDLDINELTTETSLDIANDYVAFYDASATAVRKVDMSTMFGDTLGDGRWTRTTDQSISASTVTTIVFATEDYDNLERGTFSTVTGIYTRGATAGRIHVSAKLQITAMDDDDTLRIMVYKDGAEYSRYNFYNDTDNDTPAQSVAISENINLAASGTVSIRVFTSSAETVTGGAIYTSFNIIELS